MHKKYLFVSLIAFTILFVGNVGSALAAPCYFYEPLLGPTIDVKITSGGQQKTISIPNQNPPSLLQKMVFATKEKHYAYNSRLCQEGFEYQVGDVMDMLFFEIKPGSAINVVKNMMPPAGTIRFAGFPKALNAIPADQIPWRASPWFYAVGFDYRGVADIPGVTPQEKINNEDAIIDVVDTARSLTVNASIFYPGRRGNILGYYEPMSAPATNCAKLSGTGPKKIVFMRGKSWNATVDDFIWQASATRDRFLATDPFKTNQSQFSFYADLKKQVEDNSALMTSRSSCGSGAFEYVIFFADQSNPAVGMSAGRSGVVLVNVSKADLVNLDSAISTPLTALRGTGLALAGLQEERYAVTSSGRVDSPLTNCVLDPFDGYRDRTTNHIYGAIDAIGCRYERDSSSGKVYHRPTSQSIMNGVAVASVATPPPAPRPRWFIGNDFGFDIPPANPAPATHPAPADSKKFNVVSCGYLLSAIKGEPITKENALKNFPACLNMDTAKGGIPPVVAKPAIQTAGKPSDDNNPVNSISNGSAVLIAGSGFTPKGNSIEILKKLQNNPNYETVFEITNVSSADNRLLTFTAPPDLPLSTPNFPFPMYFLKVGALNSDWSDKYEIRVMAPTPIIDSTWKAAVSPNAPRALTANEGVGHGSEVMIRGSGLTPTGNSIQLTDSSDSSKVYEINSISSSESGAKLIFTVPTDLPGGSYSLRVSALNSDWSNAVTLKILKDKKIITVGGGFTTAGSAIFSFMENIALGSIKIPLRLHSPSFNTGKLLEEINKQLQDENRVLVIGHSLGSIIAYNIRNEFQGKCVEFMYIDPPYNEPVCKIPIFNLLPALAGINKAVCDGISKVSYPNRIDWTGGSNLAHFLSHNAFGFPNYGNNKQKLTDLEKVIKERLKDDSNNNCSFSSVPPPDLLKPAPNITSILSSGPERSSVSVRPGESITITGSGFSLTGNSVEIVNTTNPDIYYELFDLSTNNDQGKLTFVLPLSPAPPGETTPGAYSLKVAAVDSDWSNTLNISVSTTPPPENRSLITNVSPQSAKIGDRVTITGSGFSPVKNIVQLVSAAAEPYVIRDLPSNGNTISFTVPSDIPVGSYSLIVRAFDSILSSNAVQGVTISCSDAQIFTGIKMSPNGSPDIDIMIDPVFEQNVLRGERKIVGDIPLTPVYDLVVRVTPTINQNCLAQYVGSGGVAQRVDPPKALPFTAYIALGNEILLHGILGNYGMKTDSGQPIYEWKLKGWPNGIFISERLERVIKAVQENDSSLRIGVLIERSDGTVVERVEKGISFNLCVPLSGGSPHKIVSMRGKSSGMNVPTLVDGAEGYRKDGFEQIEPFKTYSQNGKSWFAHYADLSIHDDIKWVMAFQRFFVFANQEPRKISACGDDGSQYFFHTGRINPTKIAAYAPYGGGIAFLSAPGGTRMNAGTVLHEMGHSFGWLEDEYHSGFDMTLYYANCAPANVRETGVDNLARGNKLLRNKIETLLKRAYWDSYGDTVSGCHTKGQYRPSMISIMNSKGFESGQFNVVSCGYLLRSITGKQTLKPFFEECMKMDGVEKPSVSVESTAFSPFRFLSILFQSLQNTQNTLTAAVAMPSVSDDTRTDIDPSHFINVESFSSDGTVIGSEIFNTQKLEVVTVESDDNSTTTTPTLPTASSPVFQGRNLVITGSGFSVTGNTVRLTNISDKSKVYYVRNLPSSNNGADISFSVPADIPPGRYYLAVKALNSEWSGSGPMAKSVVVEIKAPPGVPSSSSNIIGGDSEVRAKAALLLNRLKKIEEKINKLP